MDESLKTDSGGRDFGGDQRDVAETDENSNDTVAKVVGLILGTPEFQRQ